MPMPEANKDDVIYNTGMLIMLFLKLRLTEKNRIFIYRELIKRCIRCTGKFLKFKFLEFQLRKNNIFSKYFFTFI